MGLFLEEAACGFTRIAYNSLIFFRLFSPSSTSSEPRRIQEIKSFPDATPDGQHQEEQYLPSLNDISYRFVGGRLPRTNLYEGKTVACLVSSILDAGGIAK
ncbi:unnamed protein product [Dovyalis caffra]|uniref:Uncharacterized protein n=1 Tax=Dovyalis caffra TaxID=77055 RepID=A0AAV1RFY4_9ROSI|nr:unnamed protein product [Dovyalis caffra]